MGSITTHFFACVVIDPLILALTIVGPARLANVQWVGPVVVRLFFGRVRYASPSAISGTSAPQSFSATLAHGNENEEAEAEVKISSQQALGHEKVADETSRPSLAKFGKCSL